MRISNIEQIARSAWPALEEMPLEFGVLRASGGSTRRTNCLSLFSDSRPSIAMVREAAEGFFTERRQRVIVQVPDCGGPESHYRILDAELAKAGYLQESPTLVMTCSLTETRSPRHASNSADWMKLGLNEWIDASASITGVSSCQRSIQMKSLQALADPACFVVAHNATNQVVSCGMAVLGKQSLGIFGIATLQQYQGRGYASLLLRQLMEWGAKNGAENAYLQVEASNRVAISLYENLGFANLYSYWYRMKPQSISEEVK